MSVPPKGRGVGENPPNPFDPRRYDPSVSQTEEEGPGRGTVFSFDASRSALSKNESPDLDFAYSLNPYRGCEHGCPYCYARPYHEYLGFSAGLDFETQIVVKRDLPRLLRKQLASRAWRPQVISISGATDAYQPAERRFRVTRECLEVLAEARNPTCLITKNALVLRDVDLLQPMAAVGAVAVCLSLTTLDGELAGVLEPRASRPERRLQAVRELAAAGVPVGVNLAPLIPGLTDEELPRLMGEARGAGARFVGMSLARFPGPVGPLFESWLQSHFPERAARVLSLVRSVRGGALEDGRFGVRFRGEGPYAQALESRFRLEHRRLGFEPWPTLSGAAFRRPCLPGEQLNLLDG